MAKKKHENRFGTQAYGVFAVLSLASIWGLSLLDDSSTEKITFLPGDPKVVAQGKTIYSEQCSSCHKPNLEGESNWRQRKSNGRMPAPPHDVSGHTWHHPDIALFKTTKFGTSAMAGGTYKSDMLGYEDILSDQEIIAVLSYIKSTWPDDIIKRHDQMNQQVEEQQ